MTTTKLNTVTGTISSNDIGTALMHEHIAFGYPGWVGDQTVAPFDEQRIIETALPVFKRLKAGGVSTYVDATANEVGRCPQVYREISEKTGVQIIQNF